MVSKYFSRLTKTSAATQCRNRPVHSAIVAADLPHQRTSSSSSSIPFFHSKVHRMNFPKGLIPHLTHKMAFAPPASLPQASRLPRRPNVCGTLPHTIPQLSMNVATQTAFKNALLDRIAPLNFGRAVADNKKDQDEIEKLALQVEATNTSLSPGTDPNVSGKWDMIYTTSTSILAINKPAFLQSNRIIQEIDAANLEGKNIETFKFGPFELVNSVKFKLTPTSPKRFDVNFVEFNVLGLFKFNVEENERFTGWLEVSYLDEDLRISRGNKGNLFVLVKK